MAHRNGSSRALEAVGACPRQPIRRPVKELSFEVASHVKAYLDHKHYEQGYTFLYALLAAANSISVPAKPYAGLLPPAVQLGLAATLVVYPPVTTKATSADGLKGSNAAVRYLRCVQHTIRGPGYQTIRQAFSFPEHSRSRSRAPAAFADVERLDAVAANAQSLWWRGEDFWAVVGWAFNCSAAHHKRWARWHIWLDVMLDFLDAEWDDCAKHTTQQPAEKECALQDTLIWRYINSNDLAAGSTIRRIIESILATGDARSLQLFPEIWERETAEPEPGHSSNAPDSGDADDFSSGHHDVAMRDPDAGHDANTSPLSSPSSLQTSFISDHDAAVKLLGGMKAVDLRQRCVALLVKVAKELPKHFASVHHILDTLAEQMRSFSVSVLNVLITTSRLSNDDQVLLNLYLILPLINKECTIPPTQLDFENQLLPYRAQKKRFADNAKLSLILEQMFRCMMESGHLEATDSLRAAVETGIQARHNVCKIKKGDVEEEHSRRVMVACSNRLRGLLQVLEKLQSEYNSNSDLTPLPEGETDD